MLEYGDEILLIENQPSIRILMEWIFIKTNLQANFEGNDLWKKLDNVDIFLCLNILRVT